MLYHERERINKENANFVHIVYLLAKLCNIFDEAFFIDVRIVQVVKYSKGEAVSYSTSGKTFKERNCATLYKR